MAKVKVKRSELVKAAKELNDVLGIDPAIQTSKDVSGEELEELVAKAAKLILPHDEITPGTQAVVNALLPEPDSSDDDDVNDDEEEDETSEETSDDEEEETVQVKPKAGKKSEKKGKGEKTPKAEKKDKATKKDAFQNTETEKFTRSYAAGIAIRDGKGKTIEDLIEDTDRIFVKSGGNSNPKESKLSTANAIKVLVAFGVIQVDGDVIH